MIACQRQLRVGMGGVYGLDFAALAATAPAFGVEPATLGKLLPQVEQGLMMAVRASKNG